MMIIPIACALVFSNPIAISQSQVTLKFHPPIGKTYRLKMSMSMSMAMGPTAPPTDMKMDVDVDMKALSKSGDVTPVETKMHNAKVTVPPKSPIAGMKDAMVKQMEGKSFTSKYDGLYHMKSFSGMGMDASFSGLSNLSFPNHPLKVGESWTTNMDLGKVLGAMSGGPAASLKVNGTVPMKFKLLRVAQEHGQACADIQISMAGDFAMGTSAQAMKMHMTGGGTYTVELSSGMTVATNMVTKNTMNMGTTQMKQNMSISMGLR